MPVRDRIIALRRVQASRLRPHPHNWRTHPLTQRAALGAALAEIGYADALLVRELEDGALELIDGHLRAELTPEQLVPVLVLDVNADDACKLLAVLDPLASQAETDFAQLRTLLAEIQWDSAMLDAMASELLNNAAPSYQADDSADTVPETYQLVIDCEDESAQQALYERLTSEGYRCRVVTM